MLETKIITALVSVISFLIANKIHYGYNRGLRLMSNTVFDVTGGIFAMAFVGLMFYNGFTLYTIPRVLLFLSICAYIRNKKKKRFCTPSWKLFHATAIVYSTLGLAGFILDTIGCRSIAELSLNTIVMAGVAWMAGSLFLISIVNVFFSEYPGRYRRSHYYY